MSTIWYSADEVWSIKNENYYILIKYYIVLFVSSLSILRDNHRSADICIEWYYQRKKDHWYTDRIIKEKFWYLKITISVTSVNII